MVPDVAQKHRIYELCNIDYKRFSRTIDGIVVLAESFDAIQSARDFLLVEVKTTKSKTVTELPYGAFFGFTENEEALFKSQRNFRLCIVHTTMENYCLVTYPEFVDLIQHKRVQYQINFRKKD
jgi:hypothetical protein